MIGLWDDKERLNKFMKSVQKWMEYHSSHDVDIPEEIVTQAFEQGRDEAFTIIQTFDIKDDGTAGFLQSWVELGLFAGFLTGWKEQLRIALTGGATGVPFDIQGEFCLTRGVDKIARSYALELTDVLFAHLFQEPVSPLVVGLDDRFIQLLHTCYEASLYSGFLNGLNSAFAQKVKRFDPFDLKSVLS